MTRFLLVALICLATPLLAQDPVGSDPVATEQNPDLDFDPDSSATPANPSGVQNALVVRVDFPNLFNDLTDTTANNTLASADSRYAALSYGKVDSVSPWCRASIASLSRLATMPRCR